MPRRGRRGDLTGHWVDHIPRVVLVLLLVSGAVLIFGRGLGVLADHLRLNRRSQ